MIRSGRITPAQEKALSDSWALYGLDMTQGNQALNDVFAKADSPLVLEIGFGMGDSLLHMAAIYPDTNFIGIEVHVPGVGRLVNQADLQQLQNLRIFCADAIDVLTECIPESSLDRIQIFFPDPWHKSRHHKRRLVQAHFVTLAVSRLKTGGLIHMATDWLPYAESALEVFENCPDLTNHSGDGPFSKRPDYRPETKFERRGVLLGHSVSDLIFMKRPSLNDPELTADNSNKVVE